MQLVIIQTSWHKVGDEKFLKESVQINSADNNVGFYNLLLLTLNLAKAFETEKKYPKSHAATLYIF